MSLFTKLVDRIFAVSGALLFMQAPQFIQNYTQNLSGHLAELNYQLRQLSAMTSQSGRTILDLSSKFLNNEDPDVIFQGHMLKGLVERQSNFHQAFTSLSESTPFTKPFIFFRYLDWDLAKETAHSFKLGVPLTLEGITWGLLGLFAGYFLFRLLSRLVRALASTKSSTTRGLE